MSALVIFSLSFSSLLMLPLMNQPLNLGLVIMMSTLWMCVVSAITLSSWYSYILFLIYVGGLLVMFAYVAALSPNVLFGKSTPMLFFLTMSVLFMVVMFFFPIVDSSSTSDIYSYNTLKFLKTYSAEMVSPQMVSILVGLAIILLINLIVVVKICYYQRASLRPYQN
uniref:NADH dehydrogenase subunit 6 n=1 Tax=Splendrillia sp. 1 MNHN IM 2013-9619 TaxID=2259841 RepID=A0A344H1L6_9CAEN|nr:NADH dehydrogenase subunit 6 [Splendrillia sp. 1 MNHN IM 2013-9619]AXA45281.1 NADH dehydrogenase subunit 6 [Splendrillia sp. 1 MNHN IM 2013-9619]